MVIDTSAILALVQEEPEHARFREKIERDGKPLLSAVSLVECSIIIASRFGDTGLDKFDLLLNALGIEIVATDRNQAYAARRAYRKFGKGHHPAALNFGDCFSYALSTATGEPLLYKGNDFSRTDVEAA
ncbi:MAG: type II toxin-antitoxin system VapC family toxin [Alphaproteobacteria bacterium]